MKAGMHRLFAVVVLLSQLYSAPVLADTEPAGYRVAIDDAIAEFSARRFEEARSLFARAHGLYPNARTLRGLGLAEFELREYVACVEHLEAALQSSAKPLTGELRDETQALRDRAAGFVARLTVKSRPEASRLVVDGVQAPRAHEPLLLSFGMHTLELFSAGYEPERRSLLLAAGEERTLDIEFQRPRERAQPSEARWYQSPWLWVAVGAVVLGGAAAGIAVAASPGSSASSQVMGTSGVRIQSQ